MHSERLQKPLPVNTSGFTFGNAADETTEQVSHEQTYEAYDAHFLYIEEPPPTDTLKMVSVEY